MEREGTGLSMKTGIAVFSTLSVYMGLAASAFAASQVDPSVVEARRQMVDFALKNPGASAEKLQGRFEETIGAAEKKAQDKVAGSRSSKARKKKPVQKGAKQSAIRLQEGDDGKLRVLHPSGESAGDRGASGATKASNATAKKPGDKSSHDDPSPLPFTGPKSMDFRPTPNPSPSASASNSL